MGSDETMTEWYLAVDPGEGVTTVAIGPEKVADLAQITVKAYPGVDASDAVGQLLAEEGVDPADVLCAVAVTEPATGQDALWTLSQEVKAALGHGPVVFIDRVEARLRSHLEGEPGASASAAAVLTVGDSHRGERPTLDLTGAEALFDADPVCFERWAIGTLDGIVADYLDDQGIDGEIWCPGSMTSDTDRLLVVVKGGDHHDARMVEDLVGAVRAHEVAGGVLVFMTEPPPEVYEAAQRVSASHRGHDQEGVPLAQVLTVPEVLDGRVPSWG